LWKLPVTSGINLETFVTSLLFFFVHIKRPMGIGHSEILSILSKENWTFHWLRNDIRKSFINRWKTRLNYTFAKANHRCREPNWSVHDFRSEQKRKVRNHSCDFFWWISVLGFQPFFSYVWEAYIQVSRHAISCNAL